MQKTLAKCESRGAFLFNPKFRKLWLESKWNRPLFLVQFGQNIWQHLGRWSTLDCPTGMTKMTLSIWHKLLSPLLLICTLLKSTYRNTQWLGSGLYNWNVLVYHRDVWNFSKFRTRIFVEWNTPQSSMWLAFICCVLGWQEVLTKIIWKTYRYKSIIYTVSLEYKVTPKVQCIQGCH